MADDNRPRSRGALKGLLIALGVGVLVFVVFVLPAEFGRDPTGLGRVFGLDAMKAPATAAQGPSKVTLTEVIGGNEKLFEVDPGDGREPVPLPNPAVHQAEAAPPRTETLTVKLDVDQKTEIKAKLPKGKMVVYSWQVEGGKAYVDFHGHDPSLGDKFWVRYSEVDGTEGASGSLVAPFSGEHGWFWLNVSETPITIRLTVTGYQEKLIDYGLLR